MFCVGFTSLKANAFEANYYTDSGIYSVDYESQSFVKRDFKGYEERLRGKLYLKSPSKKRIVIRDITEKPDGSFTILVNACGVQGSGTSFNSCRAEILRYSKAGKTLSSAPIQLLVEDVSGKKTWGGYTFQNKSYGAAFFNDKGNLVLVEEEHRKVQSSIELTEINSAGKIGLRQFHGWGEMPIRVKVYKGKIYSLRDDGDSYAMTRFLPNGDIDPSFNNGKTLSVNKRTDSDFYEYGLPSISVTDDKIYISNGLAGCTGSICFPTPAGVVVYEISTISSAVALRETPREESLKIFAKDLDPYYDRTDSFVVDGRLRIVLSDGTPYNVGYGSPREYGTVIRYSDELLLQ